jgi:hypothetical protein
MKKVMLMVTVASLATAGGCQKMMAESKDARKEAVKFVQAMAAGEADKTYDEMTSSEYQAATSREKHAALVQAVAGRLGAVKSMTCTSWHINTSTGKGTRCELEHNVTWEKGTGTIKTNLLKVGGGWKVSGFEVSSDAMAGGRVAGQDA